MDLKAFLENFDTIAEAPGGIAKLRALILDLAVRGKLVLHNPDDEPADKLLKEIQELKEALYSDKKASKKKDFLPLNCAEVPFAIPKAWKWVRLHQLCWLITDGTHHTPTYVDSGVPFLSVKDLSAGYLDFSNTRFINGEAHQELCARCKPEYGDILLTKVGTTGIAVEIDTRQEFSIFVSVALLKHFLEFTCPRFMRHLLNSPLVKQQSEDGTEGIGNKNLVLRKIYNFIVPLPPLAEQKRIVEKVDELMALCDRLAAAKQTRDDLRQKLRGSAISALMNAETDEALEKSWAIVRDNWQTISQDPKDVHDLRRSVLQLAVRGKLVPQKSSEAPASILLKQIHLAKQGLIQEGKIRKNRSLEAVSVDKALYPTPENWEWVWIDDLSDIGTGSTPLTSNSEYYVDGNIPWITSTATSQDSIYKAETYVTELAVKEHRLRLYPPGCLIVALYGQGKTRGQISELKISATINQACAAITLIEKAAEHKKYIRYVFEKKYEELRALAAGGAQPNLNVGKIKETLIPLPPLAEQKRIVAKVDELMQMCDQLEVSLRQSQQRASALAASAISHLTI